MNTDTRIGIQVDVHIRERSSFKRDFGLRRYRDTSIRDESDEVEGLAIPTTTLRQGVIRDKVFGIEIRTIQSFW